MKKYNSDQPAFIGLDPGESGGIALVRADGYAEAWKMPETLPEVLRLLQSLGTFRPRIALLERAHPMPKQGVSSSFKYGRGFGALEMALTAAKIPWDLVSPGKWQRSLGCLSKGDKNVTKRKAQRLFPWIKVTHKTADALLIAEYARRQNGGGLSVEAQGSASRPGDPDREDQDR